MHRGIFFTRIKKVVIVPLLLVVLLVSSVVSVISSSSTLAAPTPSTPESCALQNGTWRNLAPAGAIPEMGCSGASIAQQQNLDWQIKSLLYYRAIGKCFQEANFVNTSNKIEAADVKSGGWFKEGFAPIGAYMRDTLGDVGDDATTRCEGDAGKQLVTKALALWGLSADEVLCGIGMTWQEFPNNHARCAGTTGGALAPGWNDDGETTGSIKDLTDDFLKFIRDHLYDGATPNLNDAGWYAFYRKVFFQQCAMGQNSSGGATTKPPGADNRDLMLTIVGDDASRVDKWFRINAGLVNDDGSYKSFTTRPGDYPGFENVSRNCKEVADHINSFATAYADLIGTNPAAGQVIGEGEGAGEDGSSCVIVNIGWIICPVVNFMASIVDAAYGFVASLLEVQPLLTSGETRGVYDAWVIMRNLANIAFVIVFLIVIFSQLTGVGVTNYGVKKLLPRLVIAAILVNASYWICAIAVDLSNVLGASVGNIFEGLGASLPAGPNTLSIFNTGEGWAGIAGGIIAGTVLGGAALYVGLSALLPALIAALLAIVTVFLVLTIRQALIILLIVIAPLAFVAFLLPNTEELFKKWRQLLQTLLLMYPIIAGIFGASAFASTIVMNSASGDYQVAIQIMGALIGILPLALTPIVMRTAGGVLNRIGGVINNPNRGPIDRLRKGAEGLRKDRQNVRNARALGGAGQFGRGAVVRWGARRKAIQAGRENEMNKANTELLAQSVRTNEGFRNAAAGGTVFQKANEASMQRALANATEVSAKLRDDEVKAALTVIKDPSVNITRKQLRKLSRGEAVEGIGDAGKSEALRAAAIRHMVETNDVDGIRDLWNEAPALSSSLRNNFADALQSSSYRPAFIGQGAIAGLRTGGKDLESMESTIEKAIRQNAYSPEKIATADADELKIVAEVANSFTGTTDEVLRIAHQQLINNAHAAQTDPLLSTKISKNATNIQHIKTNTVPRPEEEEPEA